MPDCDLPSSVLTDYDLQYSLFPDIADLATDNDLELSPLDRWKNSPPETEAAQLSDIVNSVTIANSQGTLSIQPSSQGSTSSQRRRRSHRPTASVTATDSTRSSGSSSSTSSAHSFASSLSGSFGRFYAGVATGRRRRRQRKKSPAPSGYAVKQPPTRPYQCTFCTDTFKTKHDWVRHENTLHLSLESWTCAPFGPTYNDGASPPRCVFCNIENPSENHTGDHRFWECQEKPSCFRKFYRKDHLFQHLRLIHGTEKGITLVETWSSEVTHVNLRCGFCTATFTQWADRNRHLAAHFREGFLMKEWKGCRGLDPAVALAVENAMPPYLIGAESTGIDPFSASKRCPNTYVANSQSSVNECCSQQGDPQPTPFELLTERLIRFVRERQATGVAITDDCIQREARSFVYGDEDPWNQTAADNLDWLQLFKDGMGLGSSPSSINHDASEVSPEASFPLPWTTNMASSSALQGPTSSCIRTLGSPVDPWMPWAWQSPECLAEFRRSNDPLESRLTPQRN
ncbi:hypothetical protein N7541_005227 [Penicillium brevicompactum]|uniref:C2H2-type domain-containing protein n=1 Tax=Penicillium brevicompactum TaxID=5074 RepID=A0A9W9RFQ3_PENBR|nr:hypothetical protein N7541_005227 [Penicillium brevicompactum]